MTTRFMLARHASCALTEQVLFGRRVDAPLDARGKREAAALARRLAGQSPAQVLSSPRRRALQTAQAVVERSRCPLGVAGELDEVDFGDWSGRPFSLLARDPRWRRWNARRGSAATPAGDDMAAVQRRATALLERLAQSHPGATLVLVTHAEVIRALLLHYLRMQVDDWFCIEVAPAALSVLSVATAGVRIDAINEPPGFEECVAA